jgi:hypothetical protein
MHEFLISVEELFDIYTKHRAQLAQDQQGRIADRTLDLANIGVNPRNIFYKKAPRASPFGM